MASKLTFHDACVYLLVTIPPYASSTSVDAGAGELSAYARHLDALQGREVDAAMGVTAAVESSVQDLADASGLSGERAAVLALDETVREVRGVCNGDYGEGRLKLSGS